MGSTNETRKYDHLTICLEKDVQFREKTTGFERFSFVHQALPELDFDEIDLSCCLLGRKLSAPFFISSMTGGTKLGAKINRNLARAAQELNLGMAVGSQRAALEDPALRYSYQVREVAPDIVLMGNLGAVQLNNGFGPEKCVAAVEMIEADGLFLHLNPMHEANQMGGNVNFRNLIPRITEVCQASSFPVFLKEIGNGISREVISKVKRIGISGIEISGAGGTSWAKVEKYRSTGVPRAVAATFEEWGIPTADSLRIVREEASDLTVIASGGIRTGIDMAKALALGADLIGVAMPLLRPALDSVEAVKSEIERFLKELRITMLCVGARDLAALRDVPLEVENI